MFLPDRARLWPLENRIRRKLGAVAKLEVQSETLAPAGRPRSLPFVTLPGHLDRIRGTDQGRELAIELAILQKNGITDPAVVRHTASEVLVHPGGIDAWGKSLRYNQAPELRQLLKGPLIEVDAIAMVLTPLSRRFFGHFMHDSLPAALLRAPGEALFLPAHPNWWQARAFQQLFGLPPHAGDRVYAKRVSFYDDVGQSEHKCARYQDLRQRLRDSLEGQEAPNRGRLVYLKRSERGIASHRKLFESERFEETLMKRGWAIVDPTHLSATELSLALLDAQTVMSVEGSHNAPAFYAMAEGALFINLIPERSFSSILIAIAHAFGLRSSFLVLEGDTLGMRAKIDEIEALLELAH